MAHMHYKGTGKVHSFKGLVADGDQRKIRILGPVGAIAWKITKFEIMTDDPHQATVKHVVKIWREKQSSFNDSVDFSDDELLAAATRNEAPGGEDQAGYGTVIFDNALFVRNLYVTNNEGHNSKAANYYIELEEVKVSGAGMAQLAVAAARRTA